MLRLARSIAPVVTLAAVSTAAAWAQQPVITSVSAITAQQSQTIVITGSGFGTMSPYTGDSPYILLQMSSGWGAGWIRCSDCGQDLVTLVVNSWTDSNIVLGGFAGSYGSNGWALSTGLGVEIEVWNAQTGNGPAIFNTTVGQLIATPNPVSLSVAAGQTATTSVSLSGAGTGTQVIASVASGTNWLQALVPNQNTLYLEINATNLSPGNYTGLVSLECEGGAACAPTTETLNLTVTSSTALLANAQQIAFAASAGQMPAQCICDAAFMLSASQNSLNYQITASSSGNWLAVTPTSGTATTAGTTIIVTANPAALTPGTYAGTLTITCLEPISCASIQVNVTLTVTGSAPLQATPSSLTFNYTAGGVVPPAQTVTLSGGSGGYSIATSSSEGSWFSASSVFNGNAFSVAVNPSGLSAGTFSGSITVTSSSSVVIPVTLIITPNTSRLLAAPKSLSFTYSQGVNSQVCLVGGYCGGIPPPQNLVVFSDPSGAAFNVSATGGSWLSISATSGVTPASVAVSVNVANLTPQTYSGQVTISSASGSSVSVPVSLTVTSPVQTPPMLSVSPSFTTLTLSTNAPPASGEITVSNSGGGTLSFTAVTDSPWLTLPAGASGSSAPSAPAALNFAANPAGLNPGTFVGHVTITGGTPVAQQVVSVTLVVNQAAQTLVLSQTGMTFTAYTGGQNPPPQSFTVLNTGQGTLNWTVQQQILSTSGNANWLSLGTTQGAAAGGQPGTPLVVSVNAAGLAVGQYYASVNVTAPDAVNSSATLTVLFNVLQAPSAVGPNVIGPTGSSFIGSSVVYSTGAVTFAGAAGGGSGQQQVQLFNLGASPANYSAIVYMAQGGGWLSVSPSSGSLVPGNNSLTIQTNLSGLSAGTYTGTVTVAFDDGSTGVIQVLATAESSVTGAAAQLRPATSGCKPTSIQVAFTSPLAMSTVQVSVAQRIQVSLHDDCRRPVTAGNGGGAQVSFSNKDAGFNLNDVGGGTWEGTWVPVNPGANVRLQLLATVEGPGLPNIFGGNNDYVTVAAAPTNGAPLSTGTVNAASSAQATANLVVPGGYVAIYGSALADTGSSGAGNVPLPTNLNGAKLLLNGVPLPLSYASPNQVNGLIPVDLTANETYSLVIQRDSTQSVAVPLTVQELQPGLFTYDGSGSGQAAAQIANTATLAAPPPVGQPVQSGVQDLTVYGTGFGPVIGTHGEPPPGDGQAAALPAIYKTVGTVTATLGGVPVPVVFSGLTPTQVALNQINIQVPAGIPVGDSVQLVLTVTLPDGTTAQTNPVSVAVR